MISEQKEKKRERERGRNNFLRLFNLSVVGSDLSIFRKY
jgi:hypothetical protein